MDDGASRLSAAAWRARRYPVRKIGAAVNAATTDCSQLFRTCCACFVCFASRAAACADLRASGIDDAPAKAAQTMRFPRARHIRAAQRPPGFMTGRLAGRR